MLYSSAHQPCVQHICDARRFAVWKTPRLPTEVRGIPIRTLKARNGAVSAAGKAPESETPLTQEDFRPENDSPSVIPLKLDWNPC
jgi:hypothetical protein